MLDSAGNISNLDSVFFDIQERPIIKLTLFDALEFPEFDSAASVLPPDWERSDSLFVSEASPYLVAYTHKVRGDWTSIQIYPEKPANSEPVRKRRRDH